MTKIAIVHEWLSTRAGSELVFESLMRAFGDADLYVLTSLPEVEIETDGRPIRTTFLQTVPPLRRHHGLALPLMPVAWRSLSRPSYDIVVSSSHAFARWFSKPTDGQHYSYVHAPMRYAWDPTLDPRMQRFGPAGYLARRALASLDLHTSRSVHSFAANSQEISRRISTHYHRSAEVIYPPVRAADLFALPKRRSGGYLLSLSRFVEYKRLDLAIKAAEMARQPLIIAGSGPEGPRLEKLARQATTSVQIISQPDRQEVRQLLAGASALLFPGHEDFGIVMVEAQAAGLPVVAYEKGGASEIVIDRKTGILVAEQTAKDFAEAIAECLDMQLHQDDCRQNATRFSEEVFIDAIRTWVGLP